MQKSRYIIIVFLTKTEVFSFIEKVNSLGIAAATTGTPKEAKIGCGIAVKIDPRHLNVAVNVIKTQRYSGFYGIYSVSSDRGVTSRTKIL